MITKKSCTCADLCPVHGVSVVTTALGESPPPPAVKPSAPSSHRSVPLSSDPERTERMWARRYVNVEVADDDDDDALYDAFENLSVR